MMHRLMLALVCRRSDQHDSPRALPAGCEPSRRHHDNFLGALLPSAACTQQRRCPGYPIARHIGFHERGYKCALFLVLAACQNTGHLTAMAKWRWQDANVVHQIALLRPVSTCIYMGKKNRRVSCRMHPDFFLLSGATERGPRDAGVVTVITGADGSGTCAIDTSTLNLVPGSLVRYTLEWLGPTRERFTRSAATTIAASPAVLDIATSVPVSAPGREFAVTVSAANAAAPGEGGDPIDGVNVTIFIGEAQDRDCEGLRLCGLTWRQREALGSVPVHSGVDRSPPQCTIQSGKPLTSVDVVPSKLARQPLARMRPSCSQL